jgi:hypothetical protein
MTNLLPAAVFIPVVGILVAGCSIDVRDHSRDRGAGLDVRTPLGSLSVKPDATVDTGLAVYPGAEPVRDGNEHESASVRVSSFLFDLNVDAAKFQTPATPADVIAFYRQELAAYGDVLECRGDIDFKGREGRQHAVCNEGALSRETQLVVGEEHHHRLVSIERRGQGSRFSIVRINARERDWD